jgi:hypothetical protein
MSWSHLYIFLAAQNSFNLISSLYQSGHVHFSLMRFYDVYDSLCDMLCVHIYMCIRNTCTRIQYHGKLKRQNKIWWMKENKKRWKIYKYIRIHNDTPKAGKKINLKDKNTKMLMLYTQTVIILCSTE